MLVVMTQYQGQILGPIAKVLGWVMNLVYNLMHTLFGTQNVALSIIVFTVIFYMLMMPLTYMQQKTSALQRRIKPELDEITKKYKGRRDQDSMMAQQEEQQQLYDKYGISMTGTCLQSLIQIVPLFALYRVFLNVPAYLTNLKGIFTDLVSGIMGTEGYAGIMENLVTTANLRGQTVDFSSTDTTAVGNYIIDVLYKMTESGWDSTREAFPALTDLVTSTQNALAKVNYFFGLNISDTPFNQIKDAWASKSYLVLIAALAIPLLNYLFQLITIKTMPTSGGEGQMEQQMKTMNTMMPLMSLVIGFSVPVGLGLYWAIGGLVRGVQNYFLNRHFDRIDLDALIEKNKEKAAKKAAKRGERRNFYAAATANAKNGSLSSRAGISQEQADALDRAREARERAAKGSLASKANLVRDYNEGRRSVSDKDE